MNVYTTITIYRNNLQTSGTGKDSDS